MSDTLLADYLADRELEPEDADRLLALVRADPAVARRVKELLIIDDLCSRAFAVERRDFANRALKATGMLHSKRFFAQRVLAATRRGRAAAPVPRSRWRLLPIASGLAAAAALAVILLLADRSPRDVAGAPAVAHLVGTAQLTRDGSTTAAADGAALRPGDLIEAGSSVGIAFVDGSRLQVEPDARLRLAADLTRGATLERGGLAADVKPQQPGERFEIRTAHATVRVIGTRFSLSVADGATTVAVSEGSIALSEPDRGERIVRASEVARAGAARAGERTLLLDDGEDEGRWTLSTNTPASTIRRSSAPGRIGRAARIDFDADDNEHPWVLRRLDPQQGDWRPYAGLRLWLRGQGTGVRLLVEAVQCRSGELDQRVHFCVEVVDDRVGWRQLDLPWSAFRRRDYQPAAAPADEPFHREGVIVVSLVAQGDAIVELDQVELYGR